MRMILIIFKKKKILWGKWTILGPKLGDPHNSGSALGIFLKIFHSEKGQYVDESNNDGLHQKNFVQEKWA